MSQAEDMEKKAQEDAEVVPVSSVAWLAEIDAALKREKEWRRDAKIAIERYSNKVSAHTDDVRHGNFNILWSNTELLRNAIYNKPPAPDVRQRWEQKDPLSLAVAQVLDRSLEYLLDVGNFDDVAQHAILDFLLPGRSVIRVRYEPEIVQQALPDGTFYDQVASENVVFETVAYTDFVCHDAPDWTRCEWIAFRHNITKADARENFPKFAEDLSYQSVNREESDEENRQHVDLNRDSQEHTDLDARAIVWEIWDRRSKQVIWVSKGIPTAILRQDPPLDLAGFFPCTRPMIAVASPDTLMPTTIFSQYEKQAEELDILTERIRKTSDIVKWHGFYDASLGAELEALFANAEDGELVPTSAATVLMERGGFNNLIWLFPMEEAVKVLESLYAGRDKIKETIYEITGISDILRGVSNQYETASAQKIKAAWGGSRVDGYKREIQRFVADTLRIAAEVLAENYSPETLSAITGLHFPTGEEKAQTVASLQDAQMKLQQLQQGMQQQGLGDPNEAMQGVMQQLGQQVQQLQRQAEIPSWDEIEQVLKSDLLRSYKIQIETDSTIAPNQQQKMEEIQQTMQCIGMFGQQFFPAAQEGFVPPDLFARLLYAIIKKTPLANDMTPFFEEFIDSGGQNPMKKELEDTKRELENAKKDHDLKSKELDIKAKEIQQKGLLEAKKMQFEEGQVNASNALERDRMQADIQKQVMASQQKQAQAMGMQ